MSAPRSIDAWLRTVISRRAVLAGGLTALGVPIARLHAGRVSGPRPRFQTSPFALGVASGDPSADGVVLWTRLAPRPLEGGGMPPDPVEVGWELAADEGFDRIVQTGRVTAAPELAHSVHAEVEGLEPDRRYWYRFHAGGVTSPVGRTRTLPRQGDDVDGLRFAFASCQHFESGYFTAYRHMLDEDLDLVFHLGDYIYEGPGRDTTPRRHAGPEIVTLDHYRTRYAQYRTDADLAAAHAAFPWIVTWDDHEVDNNYAAGISERFDPAEVFLARRAAAYQAYYEHMPLRRTSMPRGASLQLYRQFSSGRLASFMVLDTRQYRTDQPCDDRSGPACPDVLRPDATLLGDDQERWLFDALSQSRARWHVMPQQVMMARVDRLAGDGERISVDQWPGYELGRRRVLDFLGTRKPANPVVLTGDIHSNWVNDLKSHPADASSPTVGTELVCTSISSGGNGSDMPASMAPVLAENPAVRFFNNQRGYVSCEVTRDRLRADFRVLDYVATPDSPIRSRARFVVLDGKPGAERE
jgi:alkaline phosphatase D